MGQYFTKLVSSTPQGEVQEWKNNKWEEPERHAGVVHFCAAKPLEEHGCDEKLDEARGGSRNR